MGVPAITSSSKAPRVPEPSSLVTARIGPLPPPTSLKSLVLPAKMSFTWAVVRPLSGLAGLTITAMPSRAMTMDLRSCSCGRSSRETHADGGRVLAHRLDAGRRAAALHLYLGPRLVSHVVFRQQLHERLDGRGTGNRQAAAPVLGLAGDQRGGGRSHQHKQQLRLRGSSRHPSVRACRRPAIIPRESSDVAGPVGAILRQSGSVDRVSAARPRPAAPPRRAVARASSPARGGGDAAATLRASQGLHTLTAKRAATTMDMVTIRGSGGSR